MSRQSVKRFGGRDMLQHIDLARVLFGGMIHPPGRALVRYYCNPPLAPDFAQKLKCQLYRADETFRIEPPFDFRPGKASFDKGGTKTPASRDVIFGPPRSRQVRLRMVPALVLFSIRQLSSIFPFGVESAPYFSAFVASSLKINPKGTAYSAGRLTSGPEITRRSPSSAM